MKFADIPGLEDIKDNLVRAIDGEKVAHALLFAGNEGSANLALTLAFTAYLNCTNRNGGDSCGNCPSCNKISKLIHPDVHFIFPVAPAKGKTGKDVVSDTFITEWRNFLLNSPYSGPYEWSLEFGGENKQLNISREESRNILKKLVLKSFEGTFKVMIIWLPEYMHPSAANALLKILEEPPERTVFLLVSNDYERIISTILSRVQQIRIRPFNRSEITEFLARNHSIENTRATQIAAISDGNLNQAINLIDEVEDETLEMFRDWMRICFLHDGTKLVQRADEFHKASKIQQKGLFQIGLNVIRDALLICNGASNAVNLHDEEKVFVEKFSKTMDIPKIQNLYNQMNDAFYHLERNCNPKIVFLDISLQISSSFQS